MYLVVFWQIFHSLNFFYPPSPHETIFRLSLCVFVIMGASETDAVAFRFTPIDNSNGLWWLKYNKQMQSLFIVLRCILSEYICWAFCIVYRILFPAVRHSALFCSLATIASYIFFFYRILCDDDIRNTK